MPSEYHNILLARPLKYSHAFTIPIIYITSQFCQQLISLILILVSISKEQIRVKFKTCANRSRHVRTRCHEINICMTHC